MVLNRDFYAQDAPVVARDLLGAVLVRMVDGQRLSGIIVETEAYQGEVDRACHASAGRTERNAPMWEAPGHVYTYFTYGMHWMFNVICEPENRPAGVLIRALEPLEGLDQIALNRAGQPPRSWTNGPARLAAALKITGELNRADVTDPACGVWIEAGDPIPDDQVRTGPRIGLGKNVTEPWLSQPWRFWIADHPCVSR
jgi:DNA-3-methyladenine glycosylase